MKIFTQDKAITSRLWPALIFSSGLAALIYELLFFRQLRLVFGSTSRAAAVTLAAFFLGLALGAHFWGRRARRTANPLRLYALIEAGIALSALFSFFILDIFGIIYTTVLGAVETNSALITLVNFVLALIILIVPASFMGGTLPVFGQALLSGKNLGSQGSRLYALNTLGAVVGAGLTGFILLPFLGIKLTLTIAILVNLAVGIAAYTMSHIFSSIAPEASSENYHNSDRFGLSEKKHAIWLALAFGSGFLALFAEVLWLRLFAQVTLSDVYSLAVILIAFLLALSIGGLIASWLSKLQYNSGTVLAALLAGAGALLSLSVLVFFSLTNGLTVIAASGWGSYLTALFSLAGVTVLLPGIVMGSVFPYLLKLIKTSQINVGPALGGWLAANTLGAILGSLLPGFVLIKYLGLGVSLGLAAAMYLVLSLVATFIFKTKNARMAVPTLFIAMLVFGWLPTTISEVSLKQSSNEALQKIYRGSDGIIAVISSHPDYYPAGFNDLFIRLNNTYTLGGLGSLPQEQRQALLPLALHPDPDSVYFLGLGTGITVGASLYFPVERVAATELIPEVVTAAREHFRPYVNNLFADERASVMAVDGRNYLWRTEEKYDVIIGDLFRPWGQGIGSLYTLEHFRTVKERLNPGGLFAQWLPLHQLSREEFGIIARTFLEVFPQVTLWRGNILPDKPIVALVGQAESAPLAPRDLVNNFKSLGERDQSVLLDALLSVKGLGILAIQPESERMLVRLLPQLLQRVPFTFYAGNLSANRVLFDHYPLNTDDKPVIEFQAPLTRAEVTAGGADFFTGFELEDFFSELMTILPPTRNPYLAKVNSKQREYIQAGLSYYRSMLYEQAGEQRKSQDYFADYLDKIDLNRPGVAD